MDKLIGRWRSEISGLVVEVTGEFDERYLEVTTDGSLSFWTMEKTEALARIKSGAWKREES